MLLDKPLDDDSQALATSFIARSHHLLEVWIERCQSAEATSHEPIGVPEATEDRDVFIQRVERLGATESISQVLHSPVGCKEIAQGFEQPNFGAKLVVDGHAGNV